MIGEKKSLSSVLVWTSLRILINVLLVLILVEGFSEAYHFSHKLFLDNPYVASSAGNVNITVEEGANAQQIAEILDEMEIVDGKYLFIARVYIGGYHKKIQAGTYEVGPDMSPDEICRKICGMQSEGTL